MTFEDYFKQELDMSDVGVNITTELYDILKETFEAGQKNCACVHTDNSAVIERLREQIKKMKCCGNCEYCDGDNPCEWHQQNTQCDNYFHWKLRDF